MKKIRLIPGIMLAATLNVFGQAPLITTQPRSQSVNAGADVTLSVIATGALPLNYQWLANGLNLPGRTTATLTLTYAPVTDTASYQVIVQNSAGTTPSQVARVEIGNPLSYSLPIELTGWNEDVVLESSTSRSVTKDFDASGGSWFEAGLDGHDDGLPTSRRFTSVAETNTVFELRPYTNSNVLRLTATNPSGALTLAVPAADLVVATANVSHLSRFVSADLWSNITP